MGEWLQHRMGERLKYLGAHPTAVVVQVEQRGPLAILRYSGKHSCNTADHEYDQQVREYIAERCGAGCNRYLIDVRDLELVYGSGMNDLLASWSATRMAPDVGVAILRDPLRRRGDAESNWWWLVEEVRKRDRRACKGGSRVTMRWRPTREEKPSIEMNFFTDEQEALTFLLSEPTGADTQDER